MNIPSTINQEEPEPMIDIYWNAKFASTLYYLTPEGFFGLGCAEGCTRHTMRHKTVWDVMNLKDDGFERIGEL